MEKIDDWFKHFRQRSQLLLSGLLSETVDDTCGWGNLLRQLLERPRRDWPGGLLLTGPAGCGRHNTALLTAEYLMEKQNFAALLAEGTSLWEGTANFPDLRERLNYILDYYYDGKDDGKKDLCLILESLGDCPYETELLSLFTQTVYEYRVEEAYPTLLLILIAEEEADIPALLRRSLRICRMSSPSLRQRTEFLERWGEDVTDDYITISEFAELTEGVTYAQIADMVENVRALIDWGETQDNNEVLRQQVRELIMAQNPQPTAPAWVSQLIGKAEKLIERLPSAMAGNSTALPTAVLDSRAAALQSALASAAQTVPSREEFENMPVKKLVSETFDLDIAEDLSQRAEEFAHNP